MRKIGTLGAIATQDDRDRGFGRVKAFAVQRGPVSGMASAAGLGMVSCIVAYNPSVASAPIGSVNASVYIPMRTTILTNFMMRLLLVVLLIGPPGRGCQEGGPVYCPGLNCPGPAPPPAAPRR